MWRTTLKCIGAHKRRLLGTCSAVVLGVAFLSGTLVLGDTMGDRLRRHVHRGQRRHRRPRAHQHRGRRRRRPSGARSTPRWSTTSPPSTASPRPCPRSRDRPDRRRRRRAAGGQRPAHPGRELDRGRPAQPLAAGRRPRPRRRARWSSTGRRPRTVTCRSATPPRSAPRPRRRDRGRHRHVRRAPTAPGRVTYAALHHRVRPAGPHAQPGRTSGVVVAADDGVTQPELVDRLERGPARRGRGLTGAELTDEMQDLTSRTTSWASSRPSCWCSPASPWWWPRSASTTPSRSWWPSAAGSRPAAGPRRVARQVLRSVAVEALVVGVIASAVGMVAGRAGHGPAGPVRVAQGLACPPRAGALGDTVVTALLVGVVVTLVASLAPAVQGLRVAPLAALRDVAVDRLGGLPLAGALGVVVAAAGVAVSAVAAARARCRQAGLGALVLRSSAWWCSARSSPGPRPVPWGAAARLRRGMSGTLARRNAMRNPRRTAGTARR